jgi:hypothetical protein
MKKQPDNHPRARLEDLVAKLPIGKRVDQTELVRLWGGDPAQPPGTYVRSDITVAIAEGLMVRQNQSGIGFERVHPMPPRPKSQGHWTVGDPAPQVLTGLPTPDGGWIEVPESEVDATKASFAPIWREKRLERLKHELSELGVVND